ncbi:DUF6538 domain-containing protein [Rhizobium sp. SYY.PMSO]|uniref:DUF6538 domain-containing protein n=1 Tax=Rhizobium sp. SYY.PMSO TaxID=3382192 RepID=UPI00398FDC4E
MARLSYILRRGASYYVRVRVPLDLAEVIGKQELVKALGTKDETEAKRRMWPIVEEWNRQFVDLRARQQITDNDKAVAVWQHHETTIDRHEQAWQHMPTRPTLTQRLQQPSSVRTSISEHPSLPWTLASMSW